MRLTPNDVGQVPNSWDVKPLSAVAERITNGFVGVATPYYADEEVGVRYLLGTNIRPNQITSDTKTFVTQEFSKKNNKSILKVGDLLTVQSGHIGVTAVVDEHFSGCNCHALIITRLNLDEADPEFICQYLNSEIGQLRMRGLHVGSSVPHINTSELADFKIPLPPLVEQKRLANIWSLWDEAITNASALLANSRRQKQDLMQALLSGHHGFLKERATWSFLNFNEIFERITRKNACGNQNVLTISGQHGLISQREYFNKSVASDNLQGYTLLERGDFAYNKSYSSGYPVGAIKPLLAYEAGVVSSLYICFRIRSDVEADFDFLRHFFEAGMFNEAITGIAQEGARNHGLLNVSITDFFKLRLYLPDFATQRQIASIINTAEEEERAISAQLDRLRIEKRALIADLLTGRRHAWVPVSQPKELAA